MTLWRTALVAVASCLALHAPQAQTRQQTARSAERRPDLSGVWQALSEAHWNLEPHAAAQGPVYALGGQFSVPPTLGVVEGGTIPYKPEALPQRVLNFTNRLTSDPEIKCYMGGVPRSTYMPYPFQIVQGTDNIMIAYQFAGAARVIDMGERTEAPTKSWMGWSHGHWEGQTLVVDVTGLNEQTWFDRAGNYHSDALHVVERYTPKGTDVLLYEATIEDPNVFSRPWKISLPLYRRLEANMNLLEYKCVEFAEEMLYGPLRKHPLKDTLH
jgi:hypothetical protein